MVEAVNFNAPGQVVIAGERDAVARAWYSGEGGRCETLHRTAGQRAVTLCPDERGRRPSGRGVSEGITVVRPEIPVVHNVDVATHENPADIRAALVSQFSSPVRWVETIEWLRETEVDGCAGVRPG